MTIPQIQNEIEALLARMQAAEVASNQLHQNISELREQVGVDRLPQDKCSAVCETSPVGIGSGRANRH